MLRTHRHMGLKGTGGIHAFLGPAFIIFISANIANLANMAFNMVFARLMSPAEFADLTLLLTLKLGILSCLTALQFAVSDRTARAPGDIASRVAVRFTRLSLLPACIVMGCVLVFAEAIAAFLNFEHAQALRVLALSIPFFVPMVVYRGLAQGRVDVPKMVLSLQCEWIVRLIGSLILFFAGWGLASIALALALSILTGLVLTWDKQELGHLRAPRPDTISDISVKPYLIAAWPFALLCVSQVLILDSDVVFAKIMFDAQTSGHAAGLLLIQRIYFFAFLSLSMILQPVIINRVTAGTDARQSVWFSILFILLCSLLAMGASALKPEWIIWVLLGPQYADLTQVLNMAASVGVAFIITHIVCVYHISSGNPKAVWACVILAGIQIVTLTALGHGYDTFSLETFIRVKVWLHGLAAFIAMATLAWPLKRAA